MRIAINHVKGSFSERWIMFCKKNKIPYILVNAYDSNIIEQLKECDAFMWPVSHTNYRDMLFAKSLLTSIDNIGIKVYPNVNTIWHFDDKIAQKYLLESIGAPLVRTYVFYDNDTAISWAKKASFPKVFKLKGGAGAANVMLARTYEEAVKLINKSFRSGFLQYRWREQLKENYRQFKNKKVGLKSLIRPIYYGLIKRHATEFSHLHGKEIGYSYFQDFIEGNEFDIRICVIGERAFGLKRQTRKNDFRASGSGLIVYEKEQIDERCVQIAFEVNQKLKMQSVAFDFVFSKKNEPLIVEISYGFMASAYDACEGFWTSDLRWHPGKKFDFCGWMVENLIKS